MYARKLLLRTALYGTIATLALFFGSLNQLQAQCTDPACLTDQLVINTGYDHPAGMVYSVSTPTASVQDPHWILVNAPTNNGPVNLGSPAFVISTYPAWDDMPPPSPLPSRYISAFSRAGANEANISGTPYVFQRKICICSDTTQVSFTDRIHVDNQVTLRLLGPGLGAGVVLSSYNTTTVNNFRNPPEDDGPVTLTLNSGTYFLQAEMRNDNAGSPMGLNIECTLTADKVAISDETCCNNGAFVSGFKFLDANCNGVQEATELLDAGWTIILRNALGAQVASTTTDVSGYYFFNITTPGTYTIEEVAPAPWSQTFPITPPTVHTVNITGTEVISNLNFGNCCPDCLAFQNNVGALSFTCTSDGLAVTITPTGGLQAGDTYSVDINGDNNFEITNIPAGQSTTYNFPHYGGFNLTFKATRIACGKPCEVEISKAVIVEEKACVDSECYEWTDINDQLNVRDLCIFDGKVIAGGRLPAGGSGAGALIAAWDGSTWQALSSIPGSSSNVFEVEPFQGNLYALALSNAQQTVYRWTGLFWIPVRSVPINSNYPTSGPSEAFSFLSEMERTSTGLYVAFYRNSGTSAFTTQQIHHFNGSGWAILPDPPLFGAGAGLQNYYQLGQYNDQPLIRVDLLDGAFVGSTYLAVWNGASWVQLTAPFFMSTFNPVTYNASGITSVKQTGTDLIAVGSFSDVGFGPPVPGTTGIARLNVAAGFWQSVGGGETSNAGNSLTPIHITQAHIFGQNIIVNGFKIDEMGGTGTENMAWFDGSDWQPLYNPGNGLYIAAAAKAGDGDLCEVFIGGEPHFGKVEICCLYDDLTLNTTETGRKIYHTNGSITSTSTITATADVVYKAGNGIFFNPGFTVQAGAFFSAVVEGCEDCCPPDPLTALPWMAPYVNDPNYAITQCMYNGDCIYQITDFCLVSDGTTYYYDCNGDLICEQFPFGGTCSPSFNPTNCILLQACPSSPIIPEQPNVPMEQLRLDVFPNPLTATSRIDLSLPESGRVRLALMDISGNTVRSLLSGNLAAGITTIELDGSTLPPGMYFLILQTREGHLTKKVIVAR